MKLSNHTIIVDDYPTTGEHLLYNTRTQGLIKINQDLKETLINLSELNGNASAYQNELNALHKMGILVEDEEEERTKLNDFLHQIKYGYDNSVFVTTILTTYACNLKCVYCFEESSRENVRLADETQDLTIAWLKRRVERLGYKSLLLNYYGGEPLLNTKAIEHVSGEMKHWCESKGLGFVMAMQTNGYLMTRHLVERMKKLGLERVRVSVDGPKEVHDRNRPLRGGGQTFERIIQNIVDCVDSIDICISMSYEGDNIEPIAGLIQHFKKLNILHKIKEFVCSPIHATLGPKGQPEAIQGSACMCNHADPIMASAARKIKALMEENSIRYEIGMSTNTCGLVRENSGVTVDQHGRLYRCNSLLGHPEFAIGHVRDDHFNDTQKQFRDLDVWQQCPVDCTYLPMCSGGCRLMSFVGGFKNFKVPSCKKAYLNEMAPSFIKRDYDRKVAAQARKKEAAKERRGVALPA